LQDRASIERFLNELESTKRASARAASSGRSAIRCSNVVGVDRTSRHSEVLRHPAHRVALSRADLYTDEQSRFLKKSPRHRRLLAAQSGHLVRHWCWLSANPEIELRCPQLRFFKAPGLSLVRRRLVILLLGPLGGSRLVCGPERIGSRWGRRPSRPGPTSEDRRSPADPPSRAPRVRSCQAAIRGEVCADAKASL